MCLSTDAIIDLAWTNGGPEKKEEKKEKGRLGDRDHCLALLSSLKKGRGGSKELGGPGTAWAWKCVRAVCSRSPESSASVPLRKKRGERKEKGGIGGRATEDTVFRECDGGRLQRSRGALPLFIGGTREVGGGGRRERKGKKWAERSCGGRRLLTTGSDCRRCSNWLGYRARGVFLRKKRKKKGKTACSRAISSPRRRTQEPYYRCANLLVPADPPRREGEERGGDGCEVE